MTRAIYSKLLLVLGILVIVACQTTPDTPHVQAQWTLIKNIPLEDGTTTHNARFEIRPDDASLFKNTDWRLYWNQAPRVPKGINNDVKVEIAHINGDFYSMTPLAGFTPEEDGALIVEYESEYAMIKEADAPLGVYLTTQKDGNEQIIAISDYKITPFTLPEQIVRGVADEEPIPTPEHLFIQNAMLPEVDEKEFTPIIPEPQNIEKLDARSSITSFTSLSYDPSLSGEAGILKEAFADQYGISLSEKEEANIRLSINNEIKNEEAYQLSVDNDQIQIIGGGDAGVFYGIQSLLALVQPTADEDSWEIENLKIADGPAFPYRGMHIDVGRNFQTKDQIIKMLDLMSKYKLNKFLFYLTEDEGWRLAIEEFPELTDVSSRRGHSLDEHDHLQPSYGSGPYADDPNSFGNGHYSREDFKEILQYAHARHIDVIPEVNFPGHARTAIMAMENRYRRLMKEGKTAEAEEYRLIDPDDESKYISAQGYKDNVVCVCKEAPYKFYEVVLDDIIEMYEEAEVPLVMMHTGGDEVPKGAWSESPLCNELRAKEGAIGDSRNLQAYFFDRLTDIIKSKNLPSGAWEEAVMKFADDGSWSTRTEFTDKDVVPYIWQNLWGNQDLGYKMANLGYPIVLCNVTNFYFDLAYDKDPREPGLYWAGFNNSKHAFDFIPYDLFKSTVVDDLGRSFDVEKDFKDKERLTGAGSANIIGLQSQLWSETIKGGAMLEHYTLPKMLGFAERAWRGQEEWMSIPDQPTRENVNLGKWSKFIRSAVANDFQKLDKQHGGYMYRIPAPGIIVETGGVRMNTSYPGMEIRYTTDGSDPTADSPLYEGGLITVEGAEIKAKCFNQMGRAGLVSAAQLQKFEL